MFQRPDQYDRLKAVMFKLAMDAPPPREVWGTDDMIITLLEEMAERLARLEARNDDREEEA